MIKHILSKTNIMHVPNKGYVVLAKNDKLSLLSHMFVVTSANEDYKVLTCSNCKFVLKVYNTESFYFKNTGGRYVIGVNNNIETCQQIIMKQALI